MENQIEIINENQRDVELLEKNRKINLQKLFTPEGMDLIIAEIKKEVADFTADIATKEGRAKIISMAAKIAKCKSPIKNLASELKEESKKLIDGVNSQWNRYEKAMDDLRDAVRKPVDEIEEREAKILKDRQYRLAKIESYQSKAFYEENTAYSGNEGNKSASECYKLAVDEVRDLLNFDWGEFQYKAETLTNQIIALLQDRGITAKKQEADAAELAQLKKEKAEREKKDAEEKKERDEILIEKRKIEIQNIISQDLFSYLSYERKIEIVSFKFLSEPDENKWQESLKLIAFERDEIIKKREIAQKEAEEQAEKKAKKAIEDAIEEERQRVAENARKEAEASEKREANKRHRNKIEKEIFEKLKEILQVENNLFQTESDENLIKKILDAISKNQIPNLTINY
jgi:hypothetical protein